MILLLLYSIMAALGLILHMNQGCHFTYLEILLAERIS